MRFFEIQPKTTVQLDEVDMSPSGLRAQAAKIGATAGMEFELIVPDVQLSSEEMGEPDWGYDERARSFSDIEDFFNAGEYNSRRDVERFIDVLKDGFGEWASERVSDRFYDGEGREYFEEYAGEYFDQDEATQTAVEEISEANPDLDRGSDRFEQLVEERVDELKQEWLDDEWDNQGEHFERAREYFEESAYEELDESDYFRSEGWRDMSDLPYSENDLTWPYLIEPDSEQDASEAAESFSNAVGRPVNVSQNYHGERVEGEYTVEPDGSLQPDSSDDAGLEFVSPPLPLDQMLSDLNKTVEWAKEYGCYTNKSTGLHMNVSVPNYNFKNLDFVKLAILLGDEYVLAEFGRSSNGYASSAMGKIKKIIAQNPEKAGRALETMKSALAGEAARIIHDGTTNKYTSINTKSGYVEFRSPGGDWLNSDIGKLENTLLRFVVALDAACDPEKYKQEYLKKFYKLLEPTVDEYGDMVKNFSDYVVGVGGASEATVKDFRRAALSSLRLSNQLRKEKSSDRDTHPEPQEWNILNAAGRTVGTVRARYQVGAEEMARRWLLNQNPSINTREFSVAPAATSSSDAGDQNSWRVVRNSDNVVFAHLDARDRAHAIQRFADWLMSTEENSMNFRLVAPGQ